MASKVLRIEDSLLATKTILHDFLIEGTKRKRRNRSRLEEEVGEGHLDSLGLTEAKAIYLSRRASVKRVKIGV